MPLFDVLCLPSKWEGLGLVLVEAMLQAVPVIGSRQGAIPEVLAGGEAGDLFDFEDVDATTDEKFGSRGGNNNIASVEEGGDMSMSSTSS